MVPASRVRARNRAPLRADGDFVLYWMIAARRRHHNFGLQRAVELAEELQKPLVILEALRVGYPWASDRMHRFVIDGMHANERAFHGAPALYYPYVEPKEGAGKGLLAALAKHAAIVVTDDYPCFFLPQMVTAAARACAVRLEDVDGNGIFPVRGFGRVFTTAASFRRELQKRARDHVGEHAHDHPKRDPLASLEIPRLPHLPKAITERWPRATSTLLAGGAAGAKELAAMPIDHDVHPAPIEGGAEAAEKALGSFIKTRLERYHTDRNEIDGSAASGLSPYLHFGHLSIHEVFARVMHSVGWKPEKMAAKAHGSREGFWNASPSVDAFLDEAITWREVGFNMCALRQDYAEYGSLPPFALETLDEHRKDKRPFVYSLEQLDRAQTYDEIWNAAQRQLVRDGTMHNYLRMLWGKKVLEWSRTPEEGLAALVELNNKYAVDGRDPNSYTGIFWVFGRYDRAWGPERPIFGTVRYMSSDSTRRKLKLAGYLARYASFTEPRSRAQLSLMGDGDS